MGIRERLESFLVDKCDVYPQELPKLFGTFITLKYLTWTVFAVGGVRFRPMSKIFTKKVAPKVQERMKHHRWTLDFHKYSGVTHNPVPTNLQPTKLFERAGKWYRHYSDIYSTKLAKNDHWISFSRLLRQDPRLFAVGLTEGLLFYKITAPITIPATLYGVVKYYQAIRLEVEEEDEDEEEEEEELDGLILFESLKDICDDDVDDAAENQIDTSTNNACSDKDHEPSLTS